MTDVLALRMGAVVGMALLGVIVIALGVRVLWSRFFSH